VPIARAKTKYIPVFFDHDLSLPVTEDEKLGLRMEIQLLRELKAPVTPGTYAGTAKLYAGDVLLHETDIYAGQSIDRHDFKTSVEKVLEIFFNMGTKGGVRITLPEFR
jgi:hypothetical protein